MHRWVKIENAILKSLQFQKCCSTCQVNLRWWYNDVL